MEACESCACTKTAEALALKQGRVLRIVLALNLGMFFVEASAGLFGRSSALLGDSLDMLGDALAYGATLYVLGRGPAWKTRAALLKGGLMAVTGFGVLIAAVLRAVAREVPSPEAMGGIGFLALAVNTLCLVLLTRHKTDDLNMSSAWVCSRNDLVANGAVILAGVVVFFTQSLWPDLAVGSAIAILFLVSAFRTLRAALRTRRGPESPAQSTLSQPV